MALSKLTIICALVQLTTCLPQAESQGSSGGSIRTLYQHPPSTPVPWIENLTQRPNKDLLITLVHKPELWSINSQTGSATLVKAFPILGSTPETWLTDIAEYDDDKYAIGYIGAQSPPNLPPGGIAGTNGIYTINMKSPQHPTKFWPIPSATWLNGMTVALREDRHGDDHDHDDSGVAGGSQSDRSRYDSVILAGDARRGGIYSIDPLTGTHKFARPDPNMISTRPVPGIGINGLRVRGNYIYYVSNGSLYRFRFSRQSLFADLTLVKVGAVEKIATLGSNDGGADDFALAEDGTAYMAGITQNAVFKMTPNGSVSTIAGSLNNTSVAGPTSCFIDRGNPRRLYVTTSGGQIAPVNGNFVEPGKVTALRI